MVQRFLTKCFNEYGMLLVLLLLCVYYSWATIKHSRVDGAEGGLDCAKQVLSRSPVPKTVAIVTGMTPEDSEFALRTADQLHSAGVSAITTIAGEPKLVRTDLQQMITDQTPPDVIVCTDQENPSLERVLAGLVTISAVPVVIPHAHTWPTFLNPDNLLNVANQIVVIAVIAVGMTMVIITGGIDLSVGSLVALSAVVTGLMIRDYAGGLHASTGGLLLCCIVAILACGLVGAFSGSMITLFGVPPFITTLAMMQVTSGVAYILSKGTSIDIPQSFKWLGNGLGILHIPNAIWLMLIVFTIAHVLMSRTRLGRYIYAVGGNIEAARLSGVGTNRVLMLVYVLSGVAAGLGGVVLSSQLNTGSPTYGLSYELYVIAAVVVGGTSLAGGEGNIIGTLIGAFIIAVIKNGMNLTGVDDYHQKVVLGLLILGAVLLDRLKKRPWRRPAWMRTSVGDQADVKDGSHERVISGAEKIGIGGT